MNRVFQFLTFMICHVRGPHRKAKQCLDIRISSLQFHFNMAEIDSTGQRFARAVVVIIFKGCLLFTGLLEHKNYFQTMMLALTTNIIIQQIISSLIQ